MNKRASCLVETSRTFSSGSVAQDQPILPSLTPLLNTRKEQGNGITAQSTQPHLGLEKLICAALADTVFAELLITNPAEALATSSHSILLTEGERMLVCSVLGATDIHDYAARLHAITYPHQPNGFG